MNALQEFETSCKNATSFPESLVSHNSYEHTLKGYRVRIQDSEERLRLFRDNAKANLRVWESAEKDTGDSLKLIESNAELQDYLRGPNPFNKKDPQSQFFFINAQNAQKPLNITCDMLLYLLAYHQVMPAFIDFLFPFGSQSRHPCPRDFHFAAFRSETRMSGFDTALVLPTLARSGREFRMCYNLKSVEVSPSSTPWSIRHTAVYHSFDVETCKAFWVIIKGESDRSNKDTIKRRITQNIRNGRGRNIGHFTGPDQEFIACLEAHNIIIDLCAENWRWYIRYLEEKHQAQTQPALSSCYTTPLPTITVASVAPLSTTPNLLQRTSTVMKQAIRRVASGKNQNFAHAQPMVQLAVADQFPQTPATFTLEDLQDIQHFEEKASEVSLVINSNVDILKGIKEYYKELFNSEDFPDVLKTSCGKRMDTFQKGITSVIADLHVQNSRATLLQSTLRDRKQLAYEILNYQSMEASKNFSVKAQASTEEMARMTKEMNDLAQKTKRETVSMRIITLVTLFYLPGTFISTIMSTDIVQFPVNDSTGFPEQSYSSEALKLWLIVTIPLMLITFCAWYAVYFWIEQRTKKEEARLRLPE